MYNVRDVILNDEREPFLYLHIIKAYKKNKTILYDMRVLISYSELDDNV